MDGEKRRAQRRRLAPVDWDTAPGLRRFWWLLPPVTFAVVLVGVLQLVQRVVTGPATYDSVVTETFDVSGPAAISLDNWEGDVEVVAGEEGTVRVEIIRHARSTTPLRAFEAAQKDLLQIVQEGNQLSVRVARYADAAQVDSRVTLRATVPEGARLELRTLLGDIRVGGSRGDIIAHAVDGEIEVTLPRGAEFAYDVAAPTFRSAFNLEAVKDGRTSGAVGDSPEQRLVLVAGGDSGQVRLVR